ncbi:Sec-independent protein translocase protein TatB [Caulobacter sp. 17J80-11]|uniref:Sec-independent protein translocase protein TatB n=1 Tax=Caulobacter sp. 17J80-11 TaxID=2763502 RepID=UPI001653EB82|nr:Sec-independent protein translocase protein TatB [Caulobacter sp. 17J80-11]MBC6981752.1 twin-arginine translocase subunit TatB [Caulobacter sp. 17J80-11]
MMPSVGGFELVVIAIVALLVVGPKDLPVLMRKVGHVMGRMRAMAADFRASFDEMARQSELDELRREVEALRTGRLNDPLGRDADALVHEIDEGLRIQPDYQPPALPDAGEIASPDAAEDVTEEAAPAVEAVPAPEAAPADAPVKKSRRKKTA